MKILICDDDTMTLRALKYQFQKDGYEIYQANNGREAQKILMENDDINMMISDIYMPLINGLELITYVRKNLRRNIPIIMVSRVNVEDTITFTKELGANDYHLKPIDLEKISNNVKQLLKANG